MADDIRLAAAIRPLLERLRVICDAEGDDTGVTACDAILEVLDSPPDPLLPLVAGESYATRDGRKATVLDTDYRNYGADSALVLVKVRLANGIEIVDVYNPDGRKHLSRPADPMDLVSRWSGLEAPAPAAALPQAAE